MNMISTKEKILRKIALQLRSLTGISPNDLSFARVFLAPWITLLLIETLGRENIKIAVATIILYMFVVLTDLFDGPLARAMQEDGKNTHDVGYGGVLDRVGDKLLIVFSLVVFGAHPLIVLIIIGESLLAYQALHAKTTKKKQATYAGKIKMLLQTFLMPLLLVNVFYENETFALVVTLYMVIATIFTGMSVVSHYRK